MKRLILILLLAACSEPTVPTQPTPEQHPAPASPAPETPSPPSPSPRPAPNSAAEAAEIARVWLEAKYPGRDVEMGEPGPMEGAAGSIYIEIPATVAGSPPLTGSVILRRVNDVPGSTPEQRRWHVERDTLT